MTFMSDIADAEAVVAASGDADVAESCPVKCVVHLTAHC